MQRAADAAVYTFALQSNINSSSPSPFFCILSTYLVGWLYYISVRPVCQYLFCFFSFFLIRFIRPVQKRKISKLSKKTTRSEPSRLLLFICLDYFFLKILKRLSKSFLKKSLIFSANDFASSFPTSTVASITSFAVTSFCSDSTNSSLK